MSRCEKLVGRKCMRGRGVPAAPHGSVTRRRSRCSPVDSPCSIWGGATAPLAAELTSGRPRTGGGFTAWLARCPGIGSRSALRAGPQGRRVRTGGKGYGWAKKRVTLGRSGFVRKSTAVMRQRLNQTCQTPSSADRRTATFWPAEAIESWRSTSRPSGRQRRQPLSRIRPTRSSRGAAGRYSGPGRAAGMPSRLIRWRLAGDCPSSTSCGRSWL